MSQSKIIIFLAAVADFVLGGFLSNGFITGVIIIEGAKSRSLPACEQLLLSLGISNISVTILIILFCFIPETNSFYRTLLGQVYNSFCIYVTFIRYWLTAWLCVFYCIKILKSTHSFFLWWKMRISRLVPHLIVGSSVISFVNAFFSALSISRQLESQTANITNITKEESMEELWKDSKNFFLFLGSGCPLFIVFLCCILVVATLYRHICQMTNKRSSFRSLQTEAHVKAARTVLSLLFLYISFYAAHTVALILNFERKRITDLVCYAVMLLYSPIQAAILVLSNPKLKQAASRILSRTNS